MFKKILIGIVSFIIISPTWAAWNFYIAPGIAYDSVNGEDGSPGGVTFQGLMPRIAAGVTGFSIGGLLLGAEIFAQPFKPLTINNDNKSGHDIKISSNYGISFIPGYAIDDVVTLFGRVGLIRTDFDGLGSTQTGYQVGVGAEAALLGPWLGRVEYTRSGYNHIDGVSSIRMDSGIASIVYRFGYDNQKGLLCS